MTYTDIIKAHNKLNIIFDISCQYFSVLLVESGFPVYYLLE